MEITTLSNRGVRWIKSNWDTFDFEMSMQRKSGLWKDRKKTMLIHTLIAKYPSNPIFAIDVGDKHYQFIEGKQRMTTVKEYLDDDFALTEDILNAPECKAISDLNDLVGKKFSELDKEYQDRILDYSFQYRILSEATEEEIEEVMFRLNDGTPMSNMELIKVKCGQKVRDFLAEIASMEFFKDQVAFTVTDRQRFIDQQKVLEVFATILEKDFDFSGANLKKFSLELKEEIPEDKKVILINVMNYLANAFRNSIVEGKNCVPILKKIHVVGIVSLALQVQDKVDSERFGTIVSGFLMEQQNLRSQHKKDNNISVGKYNEACDNASAKRDSIDIRADELQCYFEEIIENVDLDNVSGL